MMFGSRRGRDGGVAPCPVSCIDCGVSCGEASLQVGWISSVLPFFSHLLVTAAWGGVSAPEVDFSDVPIGMKRHSSHFNPVHLVICASQSAKHTQNSKCIFSFISFFMNLAMMRHILMTVTWRTLASLCKFLFEKVAEGSLGLLIDRSVHIVTGLLGQHLRERYSVFVAAPGAQGANELISFLKWLSFHLPFSPLLW